MQKEAQPRCVRTAAMPMVALNDSTTMSGTLKDFAASKLASVVISMTSSLVRKMCHVLMDLNVY